MSLLLNVDTMNAEVLLEESSELLRFVQQRSLANLYTNYVVTDVMSERRVGLLHTNYN